MSKVILVTGAGRGLGADFAREALAAGHQVVATGRRPDEVEKALGGPQDDLLAVRLDVTSLDDATAAARAAVGRQMLVAAPQCGQVEPTARWQTGMAPARNGRHGKAAG